ncbi:hypothetical protein FCM35_KLT11681 [Carex littledalei]|uniref:Uncharacterized protein n=1 Tax=Carex littledalei TaxID=544730 RepID=A0A833QRN6_9POAL|nr:hypothetical protein FCM35_KLT11681 [Carex littledalei]
MVSSGSDMEAHVTCFSSHEELFAKYLPTNTSLHSLHDPNSYNESSSSLMLKGERERESLVLEGYFSYELKQKYIDREKEIVTSSLETGLTSELNQEISSVRDDSMWGY